MDISKIFSTLENPESNPSRNGFDLGSRKVFTAKAGELLPVICKEMVPKDYFEVDLAALVRTTLPLNTAAFLRAKVNFDFFFVPMTAVWRNFDKHYYQRTDNYTSYSHGAVYTPNVTLESLVNWMNRGNGGGPVDSPQSRGKLLQLLGYGDWIGVANSAMQSGGTYYDIASKSLSALPIYAYNRIFNLHYRNAWKDEPSQSDIAYMSADNINCSTYALSLIDNTIAPASYPNFIQMHYHQYRQDLFQGMLPNQQFGSVATVDSSYALRLELQDSSGVASPNVLFDTRSNSGGTVYGVDSSNNNYGIRNVPGQPLFDVLALRKAIALQKWKEYNMRAGWKSGKQAKAMFGVSIPDDRRHDIEFIDSYSMPFMIDEVVASAQTDYTEGGSTKLSQLGQLGGKGIGVGHSQKIKFSSGERHGYFFCIAYLTPFSEYDAVGIDKQLVRSEPTDYYMPAFANLGLEPVSNYEFVVNPTGSGARFDYVLGYVPRYHEYKTDVDKVYANFVTGKSLSPWVSTRRDLWGVLSGNVNPVFPKFALYVNPLNLNTIFLVNADATINTDQFMFNVNFDIKATRPMSDLGLPTM